MKRILEKGLVFFVSLTLAIGLVPAAAFAEAGDALSEEGNEQNAQVVDVVQETQEVQEALEEVAPQPESISEQSIPQVEGTQEQNLPLSAIELQGVDVAQGSTVDDQVTDNSNAGNEAPEPTRGSGSVTMVQMELDNSYYCYIEDDGYWLGAFTATEDGTYVFYSSDNSGNTYGHLYADQGLGNALAEDDNSGDNGNFSISYPLEAYQTVYLKARGYDDQAVECTVSVSKMGSEDPEYSYDLTSGHVYLWETSYRCTGEPVSLSIDSVYDSDGNWLDSSYYDLVYYDAEYVELESAPSDAGDYYVAARGAGGTDNSNETEKTRFSILNDHDLGWCSWGFNGPSKYAPNESGIQPPSIYVELWDGYDWTHLTEGVDFEFGWFDDRDGNRLEQAPTDIGYYFAEFRGIGSYTGSIRAGIEICDPYDLSDALFYLETDEILLVDDSAILSATVVDVAGTTLEKGADYELQYYQLTYVDDGESGGYEEYVPLNSAPNTTGEYYASAVPAEDSAYYGETEKHWFNIYDIYDLSHARLELETSDIPLSGGSIAPAATAYDVMGNVLEEGVDYELRYYEYKYIDYGEYGGSWDYVPLDGAPSVAGGYYVSAVPAEGSAYHGETNKEWFRVCDPLDLALGRIVCASNIPLIDGSAVPAVTVYDYFDNQLQESVDYELRYYAWDEENCEYAPLDGAPSTVGEYCVSAVPAEGSAYFGETGQSCFCIVNPFDISNYYINIYGSNQYISNESGIEPPSVYIYHWIDDVYTELTEGADFEFGWWEDDEGNELDQAPTDVGYYNAVFRGIGSYTGSIRARVEICDQYDLAAAWIYVNPSEIPLVNGSVTLSVSVSDFFENLLQEGDDYELRYYTYDEENYEYIPMDSAPSTVGGYYVSAVPAEGSAYHGESEKQWFRVCDPLDLALGKIGCASNIPLIDGSAVPAVTVYDYFGNVLQIGVDYELRYYTYDDGYGDYIPLDGAPSAVGEYYVSAVAADGGAYHGETYKTWFEVYDPYDIESCSISLRDAVYYEYPDSGGSIPVCLFTGTPVEPQPYVYSYYDYEDLDSSCYTVTYSNNDIESTDEQLASLTITGVRPYHGSITKEFKLTSKIDISLYMRDKGCELEYNSYYQQYRIGGSAPQFLANNGWPIKPKVNFYSGFGEAYPVQGRDYTVSYTDAEGEVSTDPTEPGEYRAVITATDDGMLSGSYAVPFIITRTKNLANLSSLPSLRNDNYIYSTTRNYQYSEIAYYFVDVLSDVGNLVWSLFDSGKSLTENVDYKVIFENGIDSFTYIFTGQGRYEGEVRASVYYAQSAQESFELRTASSYGTVRDEIYNEVRNDVYTYVGADGVLHDPSLRIQGLTAGVDYVFDGYFDADNNPVTTATVRDSVYARIIGIGKYDGCERLVKLIVEQGLNTIDLSSSDIEISLNNGIRTFASDGQVQWYLPRNTEPDLSVTVYGRDQYGRDWLVLTEGNGFTVKKSISNDVMSVTLIASEGSPASGSVTRTINLVDKYNLNDFVQTIAIIGLTRNYGYYRIGDSSTVELQYNGISFAPQVFIANNVEEMNAQFTTVLQNKSGSVVSQITGVGQYTLTIQGTDNWKGTIVIPLGVQLQSTIQSIFLSAT